MATINLPLLMAFHDRDLKILWGKAASRCSMPECRKELVVAASDRVASGNVLMGENCHIVGRSEDGPRGHSILTPEERDRYPNLILLCRNHHTVIDQDSAAWPIERLHQIKAEHELWVQTLLTDHQEAQFALYDKLVNLASETLLFESWDEFSDHALRLLLRVDFVTQSDVFTSQVHRAVWPRHLPELEATIRNLAMRVSIYVRHFMSRSEPYRDDYYREDKTWKRLRHTPGQRSREAKQSAMWQKQSVDLLSNMVVALNEFADSVREHLNPDYLVLQGKFVIQDYLGVANEMMPGHYIPEEYKDVEWD